MQPLLSHDSESSLNSENDSTNDLHSYAINNIQYSDCLVKKRKVMIKLMNELKSVQ